jgi:hypothetical protein
MVYENLIAFLNSPWIYLILVWDLVWRGIALWKSGRRNQLVWFIFLFIINSVGILPIIYLLIHGKKKKIRKK